MYFTVVRGVPDYNDQGPVLNIVPPGVHKHWLCVFKPRGCALEPVLSRGRLCLFVCPRGYTTSVFCVEGGSTLEGPDCNEQGPVFNRVPPGAHKHWLFVLKPRGSALEPVLTRIRLCLFVYPRGYTT